MNREQLTVACGTRNLHLPSSIEALARMPNGPGARWTWTLRPPFSTVPRRNRDFADSLAPVQLIIDPVAGNNAGTYELWKRDEGQRTQVVYSVELVVRAKTKFVLLEATAPLFLREQASAMWVRLAGPIDNDTWEKFFAGELMQHCKSMHNQAREFPIDWANGRALYRQLMDAYMVGLEPLAPGSKRWRYVKAPKTEVTEGPLDPPAFVDIYDFCRGAVAAGVPNDQIIKTLSQTNTLGLLIQVVEPANNTLRIDAPENGATDNRNGLWIVLGPQPGPLPGDRPLLAAYDVQIVDPNRSIGGMPVPIVDGRFRDQIWSTFGNTPFTALNVDVRCDRDRVVVSPPAFELDSSATPSASKDCERRHYFLPLRLARPGPIDPSRPADWYEDVITSVCRHASKGMQFAWQPVDSGATFQIRRAADLVEPLFLTEMPPVGSFAAFALLTFDEQPILGDEALGRPMSFARDTETGQVFPTPQAEVVESLLDVMKRPQARRLLNNDPDDDNDDNLYYTPQRNLDGSVAAGVRNLALQRKLVSVSVLVWRVCSNAPVGAIEAAANPLALTRGLQKFHEDTYQVHDFDVMRRLAREQIGKLPDRGSLAAGHMGSIAGQIRRLRTSRVNAVLFIDELEAKGIYSTEEVFARLGQASGAELEALGMHRIRDTQDFTYTSARSGKVVPVAPYTMERISIYETDKRESRLSREGLLWFRLIVGTTPILHLGGRAAALLHVLENTSDAVLGMLSERAHVEANLLYVQEQSRHMRTYIAKRYDVTYALSEPLLLTAGFSPDAARTLMRHVGIWASKITRAQSLIPADILGDRQFVVGMSYESMAKVAKFTLDQITSKTTKDVLMILHAREVMSELPAEYILPIDSGLFPDHITAESLRSPLPLGLVSSPAVLTVNAGDVELRALSNFRMWCESHAASIAQFFAFSPTQPTFDIGNFSPAQFETSAIDPLRLRDVTLLANYLFIIRDAEGLLDRNRRDEYRFDGSLAIAALELDRHTMSILSWRWASEFNRTEWIQLHKLAARLRSVTLMLGGRDLPDSADMIERCEQLDEQFEQFRREALTVYFSTVYALLTMAVVPNNLPQILFATRDALYDICRREHALFGDGVSQVETLAKRAAARDVKRATLKANVAAAIPSKAALKVRASRTINTTARELLIDSVPDGERNRLLDTVDQFPSPATLALLTELAAGEEFVRAADGDWDETAFRKLAEETFDEWFKGEIDQPLRALARPLPPPPLPSPLPGTSSVAPVRTVGVPPAVGQTDVDTFPSIMSAAFAGATAYQLPDTFAGLHNLLRNIKTMRGLSAEDSLALNWVVVSSLMSALPADAFVKSPDLLEIRGQLAQETAAQLARLASLGAKPASSAAAGTQAEQAAALRPFLRQASAASPAATLPDYFFRAMKRLRALRHLSPEGIVARYVSNLRVALYYALRTYPGVAPAKEITVQDIAQTTDNLVADNEESYLEPFIAAVAKDAMGWDSRPAAAFTASLRNFVPRLSAIALQASTGWKAAQSAYKALLQDIILNYVVQPQQERYTGNRAQWLICQQQAVFFRPDRHEVSGLSAAFNTYIGADPDQSRVATSLSQSVWAERLRQLADQIALDETTQSAGLDDPFITLGLLDPRRKRELLLGSYTPEMFAQLAISAALKTFEEEGPLTASVVPLGLLGRVLWTLISDPELFRIRQQYGMEPFRRNTVSPFQYLVPAWIVRNSAFDVTTGQARDPNRFVGMSVPYSFRVFEQLVVDQPATVRLIDELAIKSFAPRGSVDNGRDLWRLVMFGPDAGENDVLIGQVGDVPMPPLTSRDYAELVLFVVDFSTLMDNALKKIDKDETVTGAINATTARMLDTRDADIIRDQIALDAERVSLARDLSNGLIPYGDDYNSRRSALATRQAALDSARDKNIKARASATRGPIREALLAVDRVKLMHACFVFILGYLTPQPPTKPIFIQQLHPDGTLIYDYFSGQLPLFVAQEVYGLRMAKYSTNAEYRDTFRRLMSGKLWGPAEEMKRAEATIYQVMVLRLNWTYNCRVLMRVEQSDNPFSDQSALLRGTAFCFADSQTDANKRKISIVTNVLGADLEGNTAASKLNISPYANLDLTGTEEFPEGRDAFYTESVARYPFEPQERYSVYDWREGRRLFFNPARAADNRVPLLVLPLADGVVPSVWNANRLEAWPYGNNHNFIELMPSYSPAMRFFELFFDACNPNREQTVQGLRINNLALTDLDEFNARFAGLPQYDIDTGRAPENRTAQRESQVEVLRQKYTDAVQAFIFNMREAAGSFYLPKYGDGDTYHADERHLIVFTDEDAQRWLSSLSVTSHLRPSQPIMELLSQSFDVRAEATLNAGGFLVARMHPEQQFRAMSEFVSRLGTGSQLYRDYIERALPTANAEILRTQKEVDDILGTTFSISWA
jgi:hypothetical protein